MWPIIKRIYSLCVKLLLVAPLHAKLSHEKLARKSIGEYIKYITTPLEWSCTTILLYISMQTSSYFCTTKTWTLLVRSQIYELPYPNHLPNLVLECLQEEAESYLQPRMTCRNAYIRCQPIMFFSFGKLFLATFVFLLLLWTSINFVTTQHYSYYLKFSYYMRFFLKIC